MAALDATEEDDETAETVDGVKDDDEDEPNDNWLVEVFLTVLLAALFANILPKSDVFDLVT